ncbi:hypothetical protein C8J57DRAFT_1482461 [Mycena rebaudengoi]|nr:hypothetical protein C8J57DRAFT_1482461 [Mycena rebaudengoi]
MWQYARYSDAEPLSQPPPMTNLEAGSRAPAARPSLSTYAGSSSRSCSSSGPNVLHSPALHHTPIQSTRGNDEPPRLGSSIWLARPFTRRSQGQCAQVARPPRAKATRYHFSASFLRAAARCADRDRDQVRAAAARLALVLRPPGARVSFVVATDAIRTGGAALVAWDGGFSPCRARTFAPRRAPDARPRLFRAARRYRECDLGDARGDVWAWGCLRAVAQGGVCTGADVGRDTRRHCARVFWLPAGTAAAWGTYSRTRAGFADMRRHRQRAIIVLRTGVAGPSLTMRAGVGLQIRRAQRPRARLGCAWA